MLHAGNGDGEPATLANVIDYNNVQELRSHLRRLGVRGLARRRLKPGPA
jgi:hypothetical protein